MKYSNSELKEKTKTIIWSKYFESFNFYFSKPVNEILADVVTPDTILFKDYLYYDDEREFLKRYYVAAEQPNKIFSLEKFYSENNITPKPNLCVHEQNRIVLKRNVRLRKLFANKLSVYNEIPQTARGYSPLTKHKERELLSSYENTDFEEGSDLLIKTKEGIAEGNQGYANFLDKVCEKELQNSFETQLYDIYHPDQSSMKASREIKNESCYQKDPISNSISSITKSFNPAEYRDDAILNDSRRTLQNDGSITLNSNFNKDSQAFEPEYDNEEGNMPIDESGLLIIRHLTSDRQEMTSSADKVNLLRSKKSQSNSKIPTKDSLKSQKEDAKELNLQVSEEPAIDHLKEEIFTRRDYLISSTNTPPSHSTQESLTKSSLLLEVKTKRPGRYQELSPIVQEQPLSAKTLEELRSKKSNSDNLISKPGLAKLQNRLPSREHIYENLELKNQITAQSYGSLSSSSSIKNPSIMISRATNSMNTSESNLSAGSNANLILTKYNKEHQSKAKEKPDELPKDLNSNDFTVRAAHSDNLFLSDRLDKIKKTYTHQPTISNTPKGLSSRETAPSKKIGEKNIRLASNETKCLVSAFSSPVSMNLSPNSRVGFVTLPNQLKLDHASARQPKLHKRVSSPAQLVSETLGLNRNTSESSSNCQIFKVDSAHKSSPKTKRFYLSNDEGLKIFASVSDLHSPRVGASKGQSNPLGARSSRNNEIPNPSLIMKPEFNSFATYDTRLSTTSKQVETAHYLLTERKTGGTKSIGIFTNKKTNLKLNLNNGRQQQQQNPGSLQSIPKNDIYGFATDRANRKSKEDNMYGIVSNCGSQRFNSRECSGSKDATKKTDLNQLKTPSPKQTYPHSKGQYQAKLRARELNFEDKLLGVSREASQYVSRTGIETSASKNMYSTYLTKDNSPIKVSTQNRKGKKC